METNKNDTGKEKADEHKKTEDQNKKTDQQKKDQSGSQNPGFDFSGLGFDKLFSNANLTELLKHLLTAAGAMGGNYFLWIKPLQEKIDDMKEQITKQDSRIKELETTLEKIKNELSEQNRAGKKAGNEDLFTYSNGSGAHQGNSRPYRHVNL